MKLAADDEGGRRNALLSMAAYQRQKYILPYAASASPVFAQKALFTHGTLNRGSIAMDVVYMLLYVYVCV